MARFSRRKATTVAIGAFALALLGGGVAIAAPGDSQPVVAQPGAAAKAPPAQGGSARDSLAQPPVSKAEAAKAKAAMRSDDETVLVGVQTRYAVVESDGTLVRGSGAVSASHLGTGYYQVVFNRNVRHSAYVATTGFTGSEFVPPPGIIVVAGRTGIPNGVFLATYDQNGALVDRAFHLAVFSS